MCDPVTIAVVVSAASTVAQGYAAKQQGEYANKVAQYNARNQENQATQVRNQGTEAENIQRERVAQLVSKQRAQLSAANVDIGSGSAAGLIQDTEIMGAADALRIKTNYADQGKAIEDQAVLTRAEGAAKEQAGDNAFMGSILGASAAFAGSPVASKWFTPSSAAVTNPNSYSLAQSSTSSSIGLRM